MLTPEGCGPRRQRLLRELEANRCDLFLTGDPRTAYYFSGVLGPADAPVFFLQWAGDGSALIDAGTGTYHGRWRLTRSGGRSPIRRTTRPRS